MTLLLKSPQQAMQHLFYNLNTISWSWRIDHSAVNFIPWIINEMNHQNRYLYMWKIVQWLFSRPRRTSIQERIQATLRAAVKRKERRPRERAARWNCTGPASSSASWSSQDPGRSSSCPSGSGPGSTYWTRMRRCRWRPSCCSWTRSPAKCNRRMCTRSLCCLRVCWYPRSSLGWTRTTFVADTWHS